LPGCWLVLVRHGRTELNQRNVYAGASDVELDEVGREQAAALADRLRELSLSALYCSPLTRALQTAQPIAAACGLDVQVRDELAELRMGAWQGLGPAEIAQRFPVEWDAWCRNPASLDVPHIESLSSAAQRVRRLVGQVGRDCDGKCVALLTHDGIVRLIVLTSLGLDLRHYRSFRVRLGSLSVVEWKPKSSHLWLLDDTSHHESGGLGFLRAAAGP